MDLTYKQVMAIKLALATMHARANKVESDGGQQARQLRLAAEELEKLLNQGGD